MLFGLVLRRITDHVRLQLVKPELRDVKSVYLVGGFGACQLLQVAVKEMLESINRGKISFFLKLLHFYGIDMKKVDIMYAFFFSAEYKFVCPSECQLAIVKGAVILGHNLYTGIEILKRCSKMTYGVGNYATYIIGTHGDSTKPKVVSTKKFVKKEVLHGCHIFSLL